MSGLARRGVCLGIAVATRQEARSLFPYCTPFLQAPPGSDRIVLEVTGIGPQRAAAGAARLLASGATSLLSWGTAAGLDPALSPGALLLPRSIVTGAGSAMVTADWHRVLHAALGGALDVAVQPLAVSEVLLQGSSDKQALQARTGAVAGDMESGALAAAAAAAGVPFLVLRAVADPAHAQLPRCAATAVGAAGELRLGALLIGLLQRPWDLPALLRLARWFGAAERTLHRAAALQLPSLFGAPA